MKIRAVVLIAGIPRLDGVIFTEDALRNAAKAYGAPYHYDEETKSLVYEGEAPLVVQATLDEWVGRSVLPLPPEEK